MARTAALLVEGVPEGEAMVRAGYSAKYAHNPHQLMRREQMVAALRRLAPQCTEELIEGTTVRAMTGRDVGHALQGANLAARIRGMLVERRENVNVNVDGADGIAAMRDELARLYAGDTLPRPGSEPDLKSQPQRASAAAAPPVDRDSNDA